jgi:hypothetical protein
VLGARLVHAGQRAAFDDEIGHAAMLPVARGPHRALGLRRVFVLDADDDRGAEMPHTLMSIHRSMRTHPEGMTRVAERAEPWNPGACRRR